jgi:hypothetical protein
MQRVRMSLPHFKLFGWEAEVVAVHPDFTDMGRDELLKESIPGDIKIHWVKAFNKKWTSKIGMGSIALRSLPFYKSKVNQLIKTGRYDLIYFSTTQFPVCILGAYWKRRFKIPYVVDMQDPWHSDYYKNKPKNQRPPKYWFSYRLNKYLEPFAIKSADGLISVSDRYIADLKQRYPEIAGIPAYTIPFGAFEPDIQIAAEHHAQFEHLLSEGSTNIVYAGRGGADMYKAITPLFLTLQRGLIDDPARFNRLRFYFIGTSYAPAGGGKATILPLAKSYNVQSLVVELPNRISYYHALFILQSADGLFIPGSDDAGYSASKLYPYLLLRKPVLAVFNKESPAIDILNEYGVRDVYNFNEVTSKDIIGYLHLVTDNPGAEIFYNSAAIEKYSAKNMTLMQCRLFNEITG